MQQDPANIGENVENIEGRKSFLQKEIALLRNQYKHKRMISKNALVNHYKSLSLV
jgi:hypothetical protein